MKAFDYSAYDYIVSIDFGTTYSGSCYIKISRNTEAIDEGDYSKLKDEIKDIKWLGANSQKVPTIVIYSKEKKELLLWGSDAYETWKNGYSDKLPEESYKEAITLRKFKLKLKNEDTEQDRNDEDDSETLDPKFEHLYFTATIDYLRNINDATFNHIKNTYFNVDKEQIRYILTVPAEWTENERNAMRVMAIRAGIISRDDHENRLLIINESYAATFYCENEIAVETKDKADRKKEGYRYLVCDAGGGTVDLATYESTLPFTEGDNEKNVIGRCQLTTDSGKKCGSGYVDDRMESLLIEILLHDADDVPMENKKAFVAPLMVQFIDDYKLNFDVYSEDEGSDDEYIDGGYNDEEEYDDEDNMMDGISFMLSKVDLTKIRLLPITDESPKYQFYDEYGILTVHRDEICSRVFDPVVKEVILLIENQIRNANSKIDTTYLLGGFGNSPYLMRRIREHFSENEAGEITNSKSNDSPGELAAMRGAIYYGLDSLRSTQLTSIETVRFKDQRFNPNDFSILLCFDIGYDFSRCGYYFLKEGEDEEVNKKAIDYKNITWITIVDSEQFRPGRNHSEPHIIPTIIEYIGDEDDENRQSLWGAEVDPNSKKKTSLSRIVSINKDECHEFYENYLNGIYTYACNYLQDLHPEKFNREKLRYCLTIENCFDFFSSREEVRQVAKEASIISDEDDPKRLLLINREDASSIFYEDSQYIKEENVNSYSWFIDLDGENNSGTLSLYEVKPQDSYSKDSKVEDPKLMTEEPIPFEFDLMATLVREINNFSTTLKDCGVSKQSKEVNSGCLGSKHSASCVQNLKSHLEDFFDKNPNFYNDNSGAEKAIDTDCFSILFTIPGLIQYIIKPSIQKLADNLLKKVSEDDVSKTNNQIDNMLIRGTLAKSVPLLAVMLKEGDQRRMPNRNDIGTILRECLDRSDLSVVKRIEDIMIIDDKRQYLHPPVLKTQGENVVKKKKKAYLNHFMQIQILRDCVYLTFHEATTISGKVHCNANRNIRKLRSTTVEFDFVSFLFDRLQHFCYTQLKRDDSSCKDHDNYSEAYEEGLLKGLLDYAKYHLNLEDNTDFEGKSNQIHHPFGACCSFKLSPHDFISRILKPTIKSVIDEIYAHILQANMLQQYILDNVVMVGEFLDASDDLKTLIQNITHGELFSLDICNEKKDIIESEEDCRGNEVIFGAAIHGLDPTVHTLRIARRTYAVSVIAYNNMFEKREIDLYHQPTSGSSKIDKISIEHKPFILIHKGDKLTAEVQTIGTFKRFFAKEDCIVYAVIQATEEEANGARYNKIHQFEVSLSQDQMYQSSYGSSKTRLSFEIRMVFPNNNETRFEANILNTFKQSDIPEFRFRDQILVTNFYD